MAQFGDQPGAGKEAEAAVLVGVNDHGVVRLAPADEGDKTVLAGVCALEAAVVAIDGEAVAHGKEHDEGV
jgi:hypothetical protein